MGSKLYINILTQEKIIYQNFFSINLSLYKFQCPPIQYYSRDMRKHTQTLTNHGTYKTQSRVRGVILATTEICPASDTPELPCRLHSVMNTLWDQVRILHEIRGDCYVRSGVNIAYQGWIFYQIRSEYCMRSGVKIVGDKTRILCDIRLECCMRLGVNTAYYGWILYEIRCQFWVQAWKLYEIYEISLEYYMVSSQNIMWDQASVLCDTRRDYCKI